MRTRGVRYYVNLALFVPIAFLLLTWGISAYQGFVSVAGILYPGRQVPCCGTPADAGYAFEDVTLATQDGITLSGWYLPTRNSRAIIMAHGAGANRMAVWELGRRLNDHGYGALLLDLRAHGESGGQVFTRGWLDILAGVEFLQTRAVEHIGAYGFSLGANMVLQAAAQSPAIEAAAVDGASPVVLSDFPFPRTLAGLLYLPYDIIYWSRLEALSGPDGGFAAVSNRDAVRAIAPRPLLLIAAGAEASGFETAVNQALSDAARQVSPSSVQYWVIEDVYHGGGFGAYPDTYLERLTAFFAAAWAPERNISPP